MKKDPATVDYDKYGKPFYDNLHPKLSVESEKRE